MPVIDHLYTTDQVAKLLQIHPLTVLKYINSGKLRAVRLGRVYRVTETSLQKFLEDETT